MIVEPARARDLDGAGTPECVWAESPQLAALPVCLPEPPADGRVIVVAPHPDDEILGVGGTIARLGGSGTSVVLVAVTDGEHSHPGLEDHLRAVRPHESLAAAARLGIQYHAVCRLQHPDGHIDEAILVEQLTQMVGAGDLVLAPWAHDGHPDHDAAGRAAVSAAARSGADLFAYLVWAWHWAHPEDLPWDRAFRVDIADLAASKRSAAACFHSQMSIDPVVLPLHVRSRLLRSYEVVLCS